MNNEGILNLGFEFIYEDDLANEFIRLVELRTGSKHIKTEREKDYFHPYILFFRPIENTLEISEYYLKEKLSHCLCGKYYNCEDGIYYIKISIVPVKLYENIASLLHKDI